MAEDASDTIVENALSPAKASGDGGAMEQHPIPDQIAAVKFAASNKAVKRGDLGLRPRKIIPHGTVI